jgi:hypothetical protein
MQAARPPGGSLQVLSRYSLANSATGCSGTQVRLNARGVSDDIGEYQGSSVGTLERLAVAASSRASGPGLRPGCAERLRDGIPACPIG